MDRPQDFSHTTVSGGGQLEFDAFSIGVGSIGRRGLQDDFAEAFAVYFGLEIIDPGEAAATFSGVNTVPAATGVSRLKQTWSLPLYVGVRAPATLFGINSRNLDFFVRGGVNFDRWRASFSLTELGAPGAPGTSASDTWWSAGPAVGVGALYHFAGSFVASVTATWAFAGSHSLGAHSPNFASESYTLATGDRTVTTVMFTLGKSFALGR